MLLEHLRKIYNKIIIHAKYSEPHYKLLGLLGFIGFPAYYVIWKYIFPQPYENLTLRLIGGLFGLLLLLKDKWPNSLKPYLPLFWYIAILCCITIFFNFMMLKNDLNLIWVMSMMAAVFIVILIVDWVSFFILYILGSIIAWYCYLLSNGSTQLMISYLGYCAVFLFVGIVGALFIYNTARLQKERLEAMGSLSGNVAHELRTPLLGLRGAIAGFKKYLPILHDAYLKAKESNIEVPSIRRNHLNNLLPTLDRMDSEIHFANTIIDMLLMNVGKNKIDSNNFEIYSVSKVVDEALRRYPFDSAELEAKIHWDPSNDFEFNGISLLLEHIIFNLMKNALHFIVTTDKGEIFIWLERGKKFNRLHFKDTGKGISAEALPQLFERFFTTTLTGTGIGLSFCKMVMKSFEGNITCRSIEGQFAEFILYFPLVNKTEE